MGTVSKCFLIFIVLNVDHMAPEKERAEEGSAEQAENYNDHINDDDDRKMDFDCEIDEKEEPQEQEKQERETERNKKGKQRDRDGERERQRRTKTERQTESIVGRSTSVHTLCAWGKRVSYMLR